MLTRLTLRKPFQVGRGGMLGVYRFCTRFALDGVIPGSGAEVQARPAHPEGVFPNLLLQHPAGLTVQVSRDLEPAGDVAEVGDQDQGDATCPERSRRALFLPRERRNLRPPHEAAVRPDSLAVE